ncbi:hypothetical protein OJ996_20575 [Luteolibacter sp. GHJ8]|uniref:DUF6950 domain-containing protein n=1 Tax=Luteolibacter rhizosphaerae TaxID=2989719 RepID=A0ABT3G9W6_9BACT|nr:hypothetical protein [Luteolibacter rhizosphaerae]MCW1915995.1 hypothetical protein [Luteolibacter rhizosphaerae]
MNRSELLAAYLAEVWGRPYRIGQWDCILFIAEWADRLQGSETFARKLRGHYSTEREGLATFTSSTGVNPAIVTALGIHDWQAVPFRTKTLLDPLSFQPGDIILTDFHHPGIWDGAAIVAQPARSTGVLRIHFDHATFALRFPAEPHQSQDVPIS